MRAIRGHPWRQVVLAALLLALSMAVATVLVPPDPSVVTAVADTPAR